MSATTTAEPLPIPESTTRRRPIVRLVVMLILLTAIPLSLWASGLSLKQLWPKDPATLPTHTIDEGDINVFVVEGGSLESANNTTIKCKVEALLGTVGGTQTGTGAGAGAAGGTRPAGTAAGGSSGGTVSTVATAAGAQGARAQPKTTNTTTAAGAATANKSVRTAVVASAANGGTATTGTTSTATASTATTGAATGSTGTASGTTGSTGGTSTTANTPVRPTITSFTLDPLDYVPLRPVQTLTQQTTAAAAAAAAAAQQQQQQQGGRGGNQMMQEKPGSTRIISIVPEGTRVQAGEVICQLDSAAFEDELQAQVIRWAQAKAWVDQAKSLLEVNKITLKEYEKGTLPQDRMLIDQYIQTCKTALEQARRNLQWSLATQKLKMRSSMQVEADQYSVQQAEIALREANRMKDRLDNYTAGKLIKTFQANIKANEADLLAQESSFQLETDRKRKLEQMIENCTIRAPRDGIVVYANQANRWGMTQVQIQEGVTVHEGMALINLPDPKRMRVKVRVNESKISQIQPGQGAEIETDAFAGRKMHGTVAEVVPIAVPLQGSDVRVYDAYVTIDSGAFEDLRPGLSAQVLFYVGSRQHVTRVPVQAVRWVQSRPFVAVTLPGGVRWREIQLGLVSPAFAEVVSGLKPGDRVIAQPETLSPPQPRPLPEPARRTLRG